MAAPAESGTPAAPPGITRKNTSAFVQADDFESLFTKNELLQQLGPLAYPPQATSIAVIPRKTRYQTAPVVRNLAFRLRLQRIIDGRLRPRRTAALPPSLFVPLFTFSHPILVPPAFLHSLEGSIHLPSQDPRLRASSFCQLNRKPAQCDPLAPF